MMMIADQKSLESFEDAKNDMIDKAVMWLSQRGWTSDVQITMFKKEMEEKQ